MSTKDELQTSINSRLTSKPTLIEGGSVQDIVGSVSYELANIIDTKIGAILKNAFVTTADEEHLIIKGEELGIKRKNATFASVMASISGAAPNFEITTDVQAKTSSNIVFQVSTNALTDSEGNCDIKMECLSEGSIGNINIGELTEFCFVYEGLSNAQIANLTAGYGGYDEETTEDYRERILDYMRDDACNSNIADYSAWAKSVSGVKNVVVQDSNTAGAGKVNVYISSSNNDEVPEELLLAVKNKIENLQIINAKVRVYPLERVLINVSAGVTLESGAILSEIREKFLESLEKYLNKKPSKVSYLNIVNLLFDTEGVENVDVCELNNGTSSIAIGSLEIPVAGTITINEEEEE